MPTKKDFDNLSPADFMDQVEAERAARDYADEPYEFLRVQQEKRRRRRKELWTRSALFVLAVLAFIGLVMAWSCAPASAHSWYDFACCNESDCYQTTAGEVERHDDGWYVVATAELIGFSSPKIKRSLDPLIHRCFIKTYVDKRLLFRGRSPTRCLYVPEVAG